MFILAGMRVHKRGTPVAFCTGMPPKPIFDDRQKEGSAEADTLPRGSVVRRVLKLVHVASLQGEGETLLTGVPRS